MVYEHSSGGGSFGDLGEGLQETLNQLSIGLAQHGITELANSSAAFTDVTCGSNNTNLTEAQAGLETAQNKLEVATDALQSAADGIIAYAGSVGIDGLAVPENSTAAVSAAETSATAVSPDAVSNDPAAAENAGQPNGQRQVNVYKTVDGVMIPETKASDLQQEVRDHFEQARQELIRLFPSQTKGLNMDRINSFLEDLGLKQVTTIIVPQHQRDAVLRKVRDLIGSCVPPTVGGFYNHGLNLTFIFRDPKAEKANGREFGESTIIHEMAHGTNEHDALEALILGAADDDVSVHSPRVGFIEQPDPEKPAVGKFWEEGFAERFRSEYITQQLRRPRGFSSYGVDNVDIPVDDSMVPFPAKYLHKGPHKGREISRVESFAGAALDHLIERDPEIANALLRARKSNAGVEELVRRINAISPGLYERMRDDFNSTGTFARGYKSVLQATGAIRS
ncbi:MAG TPA: hypothetical protein VMR45_03395 [Patescibacteria group bacterium]|nr:hypothetical protein [Patescibacteria group bacterium]